MPKVKNISELRHLRMKGKSASQEHSKFRPSEIYISVLGNGAKCNPRSLYIFCDQGRYLFNCGEGTQRLAHEHKMKLSKLEHVFVTHKSWENVGGLLGLSLTVQDIGLPEITLHGPPDIDQLYSLTRSFVPTRDLNIVYRHHEELPFVDNCMEVKYVSIYSSSASPSNGTFSDNPTGNIKNGVGLETEDRTKRLKLVESAHKPDVAIAYICKGHSKPGRLVLKKCVELGVPAGPLLGELKNGKDVELPCGKVVRSQDVVSPEEPCPLFLVVECPSEDFLDNFVNEKQFKCCQNSDSPLNIASLVVHFTPPNIMNSGRYKRWMKKFPEATCHLVLNSDNPTASSAAVHRIQHKLNLVHPKIFGLLNEEEQKNSFHHSDMEGLNIVQADTLNRYYLRPHRNLDHTSVVKIEPETYVQEATSVCGFHDSLEQLQIAISSASEEICQSNEYPEVVFLGTGSSIPSKVRNVSSILVKTGSYSSILLDCGEGTYGQLQRVYGCNDLKNVLQNIRSIFISHLHADHHLGFFQILKERKIAFDSDDKPYSPLTVVAPKNIISWFHSYDQAFEPVEGLFRSIPCSALKFDCKTEFEAVASENWLRESCEDYEISTVPVNHCYDAYGVILTSENKWKIVYSGDTTPCQLLVDAGKDCTLLIHEATMEDDLEDEAALKMHSTTSQAISIAEQMQAQHTILTHFSQRYAKVPVFSENFHNHIGCSFDNMRVKLSDLRIIPLFIPTLKCLFAQEVGELQERGIKRQKRLQSQILPEVSVTT